MGVVGAVTISLHFLFPPITAVNATSLHFPLLRLLLRAGVGAVPIVQAQRSLVSLVWIIRAPSSQHLRAFAGLVPMA